MGLSTPRSPIENKKGSHYIYIDTEAQKEKGGSIREKPRTISKISDRHFDLAKEVGKKANTRRTHLLLPNGITYTTEAKR